MAEVIPSNHAIFRLSQRGIDVHEAKRIAKNGRITKTETNGTITKVGVSSNNKPLTVVIKKEGNKIIIKTVY